MPASEILSSARVAPRSVRRVPATSAMIRSIVSAIDSTHPVQSASPTVRKRTMASKTGSPSVGARCSVTPMSMPSRWKTWRRCAK